jgi:hypothetical protein
MSGLSRIRNGEFPAAKQNQTDFGKSDSHRLLKINDLELIPREWHTLCVCVGSNPTSIMKQNTLTVDCFESTYALLVRSEERERNMFECVAYLVFILSAVFSIWYAAQQPADLPSYGAVHATTNAQPRDRAPQV